MAPSAQLERERGMEERRSRNGDIGLSGNRGAALHSPERVTPVVVVAGARYYLVAIARYVISQWLEGFSKIAGAHAAVAARQRDFGSVVMSSHSSGAF